ncbi:MAG: transglycosylase domain-containing protein [Bryobacterales bacterium]|nr:transglycosylase domain-containing protein [Bryobacterales bacterium]
MFGKLRNAIPVVLTRTATLEDPYDFTAGAVGETGVRVRRRNWKKTVLLSAFAALGIAALIAEMRTSWLQSRAITYILRGADYKVQPGDTGQVYRTGNGPYDERLGYLRLNDVLTRMRRNGFRVEAQARWSERLNQIASFGMFPIYKEKTQAGLRVLDRDGSALHESIFPERAYGEFKDIPPLIVRSLLYIENREILDGWAASRNPAVEWDRLAKAVVDFGVKKVHSGHQISGGSTLATQLEKVRHSPEGRTDGALEKVRQISSASLRAYMEGTKTLEPRRRIVRDYLNSIPLAATSSAGEVIGLADGLQRWYDADAGEVSKLLLLGDAGLDAETEMRRAAAYRQVLSLLLAINRPSYFLRNHPEHLRERTDAYLRLLAADGFISHRLRDKALAAEVHLKPATELEARPFDLERKNVDAVRYNLLNVLGVGSLYELDRMDLTVETTLHKGAGRVAAQTMARLNDTGFLWAAGLVGHRLLGEGQGEQVLYTLTMFERGENYNKLVLQTDNANQALNLNEGSKLELGSTAKLRTLATYLETVAEIREQLVNGKNLKNVPYEDPDRLTRWAAEYLLNGGDQSLPAMLEAAMNRTYSASPAEAFYTGGGLHSFANFDGKDNGSILTVRDAFHRSVNLVFIRIMRDLVEYNVRRTPGYSPGLLSDDNHPLREKYLARFADREGTAFLRNFYDRYAGLTGDEAIDTLFSERTLSAHRFAVLYRSVRPASTMGDFELAMMAHVKEPVTEKRLTALYEMFAPGKMDWNDRGYVAGVHPLELWLVAYLVQNPEAKWDVVRDSSRQVRQEVYRWLFKSRSKLGKDLRIRSVLEADAFQLIHASWKRQGFPFQRLVPSLATSIGSSGDTPAALAELAGVILNDGVRQPVRRVERLRFAEGTPFETRVVHQDAEPVRVFASEVAQQLHREMLGVVQFGTARRAFQSVKTADGEVLPVAGKTGTGDNRIKTFETVGKARNRTATFVFTVGDKYFGTVVAYVPGEEASTYKFSSALPVSVFKLIVPDVVKVLNGGEVPPPMVVPERKPAPVVAPAEVVEGVTEEPQALPPPNE